MTAKLYLTISAIIAVLFGIGFILIPERMGELYGVIQNGASILNIRFFGAALLSIGVISWLARDFRDWDAVRAVLIGSVVGDVFGGLVNIWGTFRGLMNGLAWSTTILYVLLLLGALYCLYIGSQKPAHAR
jgi:uncharacterized membrane protein YfcA